MLRDTLVVAFSVRYPTESSGPAHDAPCHGLVRSWLELVAGEGNTPRVLYSTTKVPLCVGRPTRPWITWSILGGPGSRW